MLKSLIWGVLLSAFPISLMANAEDKPQCAPHDQIIKFLGGQLGEDVIVTGKDETYDSKMEIFTNRKTGAWTLVSNLPDGSGCFVAEGTGLVYIPPGEPA